MKVVYAHTDSLYVPVPSIEMAQDIQKVLNEHIQQNVFPNIMGLEDHPMDLEFEKYYSVLGVGATRNRKNFNIELSDVPLYIDLANIFEDPEQEKDIKTTP